jgi:hypothetical protein
MTKSAEDDSGVIPLGDRLLSVRVLGPAVGLRDDGRFGHSELARRFRGGVGSAQRKGRRPPEAGRARDTTAACARSAGGLRMYFLLARGDRACCARFVPV